MNPWHRTLLAGLALAMAGCSPTLKLLLRSPKGEDGVQIRAEVKTEGKEPETRGLGELPGGQEKLIEEEFPKDSRVVVQARRESYVIWESSEYLMNKSRHDEATIDSRRVRQVNTEESVSALVAAENRLKKVVATNGYQPIGNVLHTAFGSFVARKRGGPWFTVASPKLYPDGAKSLEWVKGAVGSSAVKIHTSVMMNTKATAQATATVAIFQAKAGLTNNDLYEYAMDIDVVTLSHDDTFASAKAKLSMNKDPVARKVNSELDRYIADPKYDVAFIRGMHVFNQYQISYRKGLRVSVDSKLMVGTFVDGGAAFTLDNSSDSTQLYKDFVGGFMYESDDDIVDSRDPATVAGKVSSFAPTDVLAGLRLQVGQALDAASAHRLLEAVPALRKTLMVVGDQVVLIKKDAPTRTDPSLTGFLLPPATKGAATARGSP